MHPSILRLPLVSDGALDDRACRAPFSETQWRRIHALQKDLDKRQALWLSGYLAGRESDFAPSIKPAGACPVLIAYGTETNNSRDLAMRLKQRCDENGVPADLQDLARVRGAS